MLELLRGTRVVVEDDAPLYAGQRGEIIGQVLTTAPIDEPPLLVTLDSYPEAPVPVFAERLRREE
jgi:hypothetical protein